MACLSVSKARKMTSLSDSDGRRESISPCTVYSTAAGQPKVVMLQCVSTCCSLVIGQRDVDCCCLQPWVSCSELQRWKICSWCQECRIQCLVCLVLMQYLTELSPCMLRVISDVSWRLLNSLGRRCKGRSGSRHAVHSHMHIHRIQSNVGKGIMPTHSAASSVRYVGTLNVRNEAPACCRLVARPGSQLRTARCMATHASLLDVEDNC
jgi:hypothetical protein